MKIPSYEQYLDPSIPLENDFISALHTFAETAEKQDRLFLTYNKLLGSKSEGSEERKNRILLLIFYALVEALDHAPDGEVSTVLYQYTFGDFLECCAEERAVQSVIQDFLDDGNLHKFPLTIALARYRR